MYSRLFTRVSSIRVAATNQSSYQWWLSLKAIGKASSSGSATESLALEFKDTPSQMKGKFTTQVKDFKTSYDIQVEKRNATIGKHVIRRCVTEKLVHKYPDIEASKLLELSLYVCDHEIWKLFENSHMSAIKNSASSILAKIAKLYLEQGITALDELLDSRLPMNFTSEEIDHYCKQTHTVVDVNDYDTYRGDQAAKEALKNKNQYIVNFSRKENESFGFYIRGGEKKLLETREYRRLYVMTPIYVNKIIPGSLADQSELEVGDVIKAIGDFSLSNESHEHVVQLLSDQINVKLTIVRDKSFMKKDQMMMKFTSKGHQKTINEIKKERWMKWHHGNAKINPKEYLKILK